MTCVVGVNGIFVVFYRTLFKYVTSNAMTFAIALLITSHEFRT